MYETWKGYTIICPDKEEFIELRGDSSSMYLSAMTFKISKCLPEDREGKTPCKTDPEINEFLKDMQVDMWSLNENIDWSMYHAKPVFRVEDHHLAILLRDREITQFF